MLLGVCVFGFLAYLVGVTAAVANGVKSVIIVDTIVYGTVLLVTVGRRIPFTVRAGALVVFPPLMGCFFLFNFGFNAAGFPWLLSFPIFASVLLGVRAGIWSVGILTAVLVALGLGIPHNIMPWTAATPNAYVMWWVSSSTVVLLGALMAVTIGYLFDGLAREAMARQQAEIEADRRERLAALGTLTGGIAHDFNNLLQPILSDAESARRMLPGDHEARPLLDDILVTTSRARTLVRRILSFARPARGDREVVDLGALVIESERLLRAVLPASVELRTRVAHDVYVLAEPAELQQVLLNLVTNSAHAMSDGGVVSITVQQPHDDHGNGDGLMAHLVVSDSGTGMSKELLEHVFEPFFTTKRPGQGTGLGLSTVHTTVTALGGIVRAESTVGVGTRIIVVLPVVPNPAPIPTPATLDVTPTAGQARPHVVVVDDDPAVLLATSRLIERLGYHVTRFDSPDDVLNQLAELEPPPALLVSDLSMPGLSGWDLAAAVKRHHPSLPVVVMSGNLDVHDGVSTPPSSVAGILSKPFTTAELKSMLQRHVTR